MTTQFPHIFEPFTVKRTTFRNRVIMPPMGSNYATFSGEVSEEMKNYYGLRAKGEAEAQKLKEDALYLQELGCSAIVLEKIPSALAKEVSQSLLIPTIGIGAGHEVDGQVLVSQDFFGMFVDYKPKFVRQYLNLHELMSGAVSQYIIDVKAQTFPNESEQY